jgi:protein-tyrosine phosphatase
MIDLHCHLIPGIDDGPATMADSLALARAAVQAGTRTAVATPHIDHHWEVSPEQVHAGVEAVRAALEEEDIALEVLPGGEVSVGRLVDLSDEDRAALRLGGGPYLLVESPHTPAAGDFDRFLEQLLQGGERMLLAHPERCPSFQRRPERLRRLVDAGALCSITAASLSGRFGNAVRDFAFDLLRDGMVHDVSSDSHDANRRSPALGEPFREAEELLPGVEGLRDWLTEAAPRAILEGDPLPEPPELPRARPARRPWRLLRR